MVGPEPAARPPAPAGRSLKRDKAPSGERAQQPVGPGNRPPSGERAQQPEEPSSRALVATAPQRVERRRIPAPEVLPRFRVAASRSRQSQVAAAAKETLATLALPLARAGTRAPLLVRLASAASLLLQVQRASAPTQNMLDGASVAAAAPVRPRGGTPRQCTLGYLPRASPSGYVGASESSKPEDLIELPKTVVFIVSTGGTGSGNRDVSKSGMRAASRASCNRWELSDGQRVGLDPGSPRATTRSRRVPYVGTAGPLAQW